MVSNKFTEDTRVKIPAVIHLMRLGYTYISKKNNIWNKKNNIFYKILISKLMKINNISKAEAENYYKELSILLENDDLGKSFYNKIIRKWGVLAYILITFAIFKLI